MRMKSSGSGYERGSGVQSPNPIGFLDFLDSTPGMSKMS